MPFWIAVTFVMDSRALVVKIKMPIRLSVSLSRSPPSPGFTGAFAETMTY
jgi:hypothetical protein